MSERPVAKKQFLAVKALVYAQVFRRHIVLGDLFRVNFGNVRVGCIFYTSDCFGLEGLPLLEEFCNALRACLGEIRQSLSVSGLPP